MKHAILPCINQDDLLLIMAITGLLFLTIAMAAHHLTLSAGWPDIASVGWVG